MKSIAEAMGGRSFGKEAPEAKEPSDGNPIHDHLRKMRDSEGGKHMHVQCKDDGTCTTNQIGDGEPEGPHDHENIDALKSHMDQFLDEEADENGDYDKSDDSEGLM